MLKLKISQEPQNICILETIGKNNATETTSNFLKVGNFPPPLHKGNSN